MKKYELVETDKKTPFGNPLFQVVALRDFGDVRKGDLGGYIESTDNLSNEGNCWVSENAEVFGEARVSENALIAGNACVFGEALVSENAQVFGKAQVFGEARVSGNSWVFEDSWVSENALITGNVWVYGDDEVSGGVLVYGASCNHDNCPKCGEKL